MKNNKNQFKKISRVGYATHYIFFKDDRNRNPRNSITLAELQAQVDHLAIYHNQVDNQGKICISQFNKICNQHDVRLEAVNLKEFDVYFSQNLRRIKKLQNVFNLSAELEDILDAIQSNRTINVILTNIAITAEKNYKELFPKILRTLENRVAFDDLFANLRLLKETAKTLKSFIGKIQAHQIGLISTNEKGLTVAQEMIRGLKGVK